MGDDNDFGDFGFADDDNFGAAAPEPKPAEPKAKKPMTAAEKKLQRKRSQRTNMYAKSPQQRMEEEQKERDFQDALRREKEKEESGFGSGFGDDGGGGDFGAAPPAAGGGFAIWGQPANNPLGIVIPQFVPRDQRNKQEWDVGQIKKRQSDKSILAGNHGDFLIRESPRGDRHIVCVNDNGGLYEAYIRHVPDGFMFSSRSFSTLADVVKHLQRNPLYNKQGLPLYIDGTCKLLDL